MFQRWSTKKSRLPVAGLLFMLALAVTFMVLYDERSIHHDNTNREQDLQETSTLTSFVHPNLPSRNDLEVLDRFSRCNSTNEYSGKKMEWVDHSCSGQGSDFVAAKENICDVFSGKWVFDNSSSYPLHKESDCPYMSEQLACEKYGRPYLEYQHWRWQPHPPCNLKRWNVTEMWEMLMGKRMMFSVIPRDKQSMSTNAHLTIFKAEDYNATVEFLWAPFLVESKSDDPVYRKLDERIIRPDSVLKHAAMWQHADILIFNTYLWWRQLRPVKIQWSSREKGSCKEVKGAEGMEMAIGLFVWLPQRLRNEQQLSLLTLPPPLTLPLPLPLTPKPAATKQTGLMNTWAHWISSNIDPNKKRVFFVTMSPIHIYGNNQIYIYMSREWNPGSEGNCYGEKKPIEEESYWGSGSDIPTMRMVERVLRRLGPKVSVLNITQLSDYRKDGHPSVKNHWCVPGVPDVWNQLLFHFL
ncbi:hypothetical protein Bca52824_057424 [Brassica carinata]|uniref:Trichome birefringence-like N-terminal domain-containing protein n=1 Tax=Brassica carinata TaxID=52824 RepID=A0A8X7QXC9_BRACI|nr:hypothetical protein Bca52824_057424 [Brassica carinata]